MMHENLYLIIGLLSILALPIGFYLLFQSVLRTEVKTFFIYASVGSCLVGYSGSFIVVAILNLLSMGQPASVRIDISFERIALTLGMIILTLTYSVYRLVRHLKNRPNPSILKNE